MSLQQARMVQLFIQRVYYHENKLKKTYSIIDLGLIKNWNSNSNSNTDYPNRNCNNLPSTLLPTQKI